MEKIFRKRYNHNNIPDGYIYCEKCFGFVYEYCAIHGPLLIIPDDRVTSKAGIPHWVPHAALTTPRQFLHIAPSLIPGAGLGVFSTVTLPRGVRFGPYRGQCTENVNSMYCWQIYTSTENLVVDAIDGETSNWMRYVNCARNWREQNLVAFQYKRQIYYRTVKIIPKFTELLVFYGTKFANALGIDLKNYNNCQDIAGGHNNIIDDNSNEMGIANNQLKPYQNETLVIDEKLQDHEDSSVLARILNLTEHDVKERADMNNFANTSSLNKPINRINIKNDTKNGNKTYSCDVCHKSFANNSNLNKHRILHEEKTRYKCLECSFKTNVKYNLSRHIQTHMKDKVYKCDMCTYVGYQKRNIHKHITRVHNKNNIDILSTNENKTACLNESEEYKCNLCTYVGNKRKNLQEHIRRAHNKNEYICDLCSYVSTVKYNIQRHVKSVHNTKNLFQCSLCSYKTNFNYKFNNHMEVHNKDALYNCDLCTYVGYERKNLQIHTRVNHSKSPVYCCAHCSYKTNKRYSITCHLERHTRLNEYKCDFCPYISNVRENYLKHKRLRHKSVKQEGKQ